MTVPFAVFPATTSEVTTKQPYQVTRDNYPCSFAAVGLAGAETASVYYSMDGGTTWTALEDDSGSAIVLTAGGQPYTAYGPILLGFTKDATVSAATVRVDKGL